MTEDTLKKEMKEIVRLFNEAHASLATAKDKITAMACFNLAQGRLDKLERESTPQVRSVIKQARDQVRAMVKGERSLMRKLQIYSAFWTKAMEES